MDSFSWSSSNALFCLPIIALLIAVVIRRFWPVTYFNLTHPVTILWRYTIILLTAGLIGGLIFAIPALVRDDYIIKSDRWADIAIAIVLIEITSLYTLILSLIVVVGPITTKLGPINNRENAA